MLPFLYDKLRQYINSGQPPSVSYPDRIEIGLTNHQNSHNLIKIVINVMLLHIILQKVKNMELQSEVGREHEVLVNIPPLTPIAFQRLLMQQFDIYLHQKIPAFLKSNDETSDNQAPALSINDQSDKPPSEFKKSFYKLFDTASTYAKKSATEKLAKSRTHSTVIKFVTEEMEDILGHEGSAIKKMTDLCILFHGFHCYIVNDTHSKDLRLLLATVNNRIWGCTPADNGPLDILPDALSNRPNIDRYCARVTSAKLIGLYKRQIQSLSGIKRNEQLEFISRYTREILLVKKLIESAAHTSGWYLNILSNPKTGPRCSFREYIQSSTYIEGGLFYDMWHYRSKEPNSPVTTDQLISDLRARWVEDGNDDLIGGDHARGWAHTQIAVEVLRPPAHMGNTYESFLAVIPAQEYTVEAVGINNNNM